MNANLSTAESDSPPSGPTPVELAALSLSPFVDRYAPTEKIRTIVVANFPALGKLAAMRFIEWVQDNPGGVIALPTGKTPEYFIRWVRHLLAGWEERSIVEELERCGVDPGRRPDMGSLNFVQIDEFYPISPAQHNSFHHYVNRYYLEGFGLDPEKALLINCDRVGLKEGRTLQTVWPDDVVDLTLRYRAPAGGRERLQRDVLAGVDQWCQEYEERIRDLGGIGFFLGGVGPDGHIGFNIRGSDHYSTTRLTAVNYETQAAAAVDLGGMEVARKRLVVTIGLGTISCNPDCCAIIIAAGETKAAIVAAAVQEEEHVDFPATVLHALPNARFYVTMGAAKNLRERQLELLTRSGTATDEQVETVLIDLAQNLGKRLIDLTGDDFRGDPMAAAVLQRRPESSAELTARVRESLVRKIERGAETRADTTFLHTEPHHDDLMLGYWPGIVRHVRDASNTHFFACMTSGFTSVTNHFMQDHLTRLRRFLQESEFRGLIGENYFDPGDGHGRRRDVWQYLDGVAASDHHMRDEGLARRFLRNLCDLFGAHDEAAALARVEELEAYFRQRYPGEKDGEEIQRLKGMCREFEAECIWGYVGWDSTSVRHLRLGFYTGDTFTQEPTVERDVQPVLKLLEEIRPDVISVALDPESSGPDTHYKVLQATSEGLKRYAEEGTTELRVWGYRNVWYRFHPAEADVFIPVSLNMLTVMHQAFMRTFLSQKDASFPSYEHDGPFSELAQKIQVEQYQKLKTCLGREWFHEHPSPLIRATRGLVFLREMSLDEFYECSRTLRQVVEDR